MLKKRTSRPHIIVAAIVVTAILLIACAQQAPPAEQPPAVEASPFVAPRPADSPELAVAGPGGALPCGLGEVGWGHRVFRLSDYPACQTAFPNLTVYCLDANAAWSNANVADVAVSTADNTVAFESSQEGLCALFPTGQ